jgi:hypothetical protein
VVGNGRTSCGVREKVPRTHAGVDSSPQALPPNFVSVHGPLPHPIVRIFYACGYICIVTTGFILISPILALVTLVGQTVELLERLAARAKPQLLLAIDDAIRLLELHVWFLGKVIEEHTNLEDLAARLTSLALSLVRLSATLAIKLCDKALVITLRLLVKIFGVLFFLLLLSIELIFELLLLESTRSSSASASTTPPPSRMLS